MYALSFSVLTVGFLWQRCKRNGGSLGVGAFRTKLFILGKGTIYYAFTSSDVHCVFSAFTWQQNISKFAYLNLHENPCAFSALALLILLFILTLLWPAVLAWAAVPAALPFPPSGRQMGSSAKRQYLFMDQLSESEVNKWQPSQGCWTCPCLGNVLQIQKSLSRMHRFLCVCIYIHIHLIYIGIGRQTAVCMYVYIYILVIRRLPCMYPYTSILCLCIFFCFIPLFLGENIMKRKRKDFPIR